MLGCEPSFENVLCLDSTALQRNEKVCILHPYLIYKRFQANAYAFSAYTTHSRSRGPQLSVFFIRKRSCGSHAASLVSGAAARNMGDLYAESGQTLQGSFSAVSKPNFPSKYSLDSSRRDLHNALLCTALESINTVL